MKDDPLHSLPFLCKKRRPIHSDLFNVRQDIFCYLFILIALIFIIIVSCVRTSVIKELSNVIPNKHMNITSTAKQVLGNCERMVLANLI